MKKGITKALAMFCAMAMIVSVFSVSVFAGDEPEQAAPEQAQEQEEEPQVAAVNQNEEPVAAPVNQNEEPAKKEPEQQGEPQSAAPFANGLITQADITANGGKLPMVSGTYTLAEDITVSYTAWVETAGTEIVLDLAGHNISYTGVGSMYKLGKNEKINSAIHVYGEIKLKITDSDGAGTITGTDANIGSADHYVSTNSNHTAATIGTDNIGRGGCVLIENGCTFELAGGTIQGFHAEDEGGAVLASNGSHFIMSGGKITGCTALCGAGFAVHGATNGNDTGSAVYYHKNVDDEPEYKILSVVATAVVSGGEISNNTAKNVGGGIRNLRADLTISGGTIENNTANENNTSAGVGGGGIFVSKGKRNHNLFISGNPVIKNNTATKNPAKSNLYFYDDAVFALNGDIGSDAEIWFSANNTNRGLFTVNGYNCPLASLNSDNSDLAPYIYNGSVKLSVVPKIEGYNLVVGGAIKVKVSLSLRAFNNSDTAVTYAYSYDKNGTVKNMGREVAFSELVKSGDYYTFEIPVESACMTAPITVTVNYSGDKTVSDSATVEDCVNYILNHEIDATYTQKVKDVARAMIRFGTFAQMQFNINTDKYPNIQEIDASLEDTNYTLQGATYAPTSDPSNAYYAASISLLSQTDVKLYFYKDRLGDAYDMTVNYGGTSETISATSSGNFYVYVIKGPTGNGFNATAFDQSFSYSVGNVSGNYAVYDYLKLVEYKYHDDSTSIQRKVVEAYYDFARKCQNL